MILPLFFYARMFLTKPYTFQRTSFYVGLGLWIIGFVGNIAYNEILLNIRKKAKAKAKGKKNNGETTTTTTTTGHYLCCRARYSWRSFTRIIHFCAAYLT